MPTGVHFIELAELTSAAQVISTIARQVIPTEEPGMRDMEQLKTYLQSKQLLLVLDNFEQLIEARRQLTELLRAAPGLKILISSRERLAIREETEYRLYPISIESLKKGCASPLIGYHHF